MSLRLHSSRTGAVGRDPRQGQTIVLFALSLMAILAMAGLLVDGGMAWVNRRQAQAAADTATLAAAQAAANLQTSAQVIAAADAIAAANGFATSYTDCSGVARTDGVVVNRPPATGPHVGDSGYLEVITNRPMQTAFAGAVGQGCWMVSARAVASVRTQATTCNFCALSDWAGHRGLILDNGNDLRIDGGIMINQSWWYTGSMAVARCGANPCTPATCSDWDGLPSDSRIMMCGEGLYIDHSDGTTNTVMTAQTIAVNGGWQVRKYQDSVHADQLASTCPAHPQYLGYPSEGLAAETNVCIGVPQIADPLNDPLKPLNIMPPPEQQELSTCRPNPIPCGPVASASCAALPGTTLKLPTGTLGSPAMLGIQGTQGSFTICPGLYFGGFSTFGDAGSQPKVFMLPGIYYMVGGGFTVSALASIDGSRGVMIYNTGGPESFSSNSVSDPTLIPTVCPPPVGSFCNPTGTTNLTTGAAQAVGAVMVFNLAVTKGADPLVKPTGGAADFTFYDGQTPIACTGGVQIMTTPPNSATTLAASCTTTYYEFGTRGITAVYAGSSIYAPSGDTATKQVSIPAGLSKGNIDINTTTDPPKCSSGNCGQVQLHAQIGGRYSGLLMFQERSIALGLQIWPAASGLADCTLTWMTDGVPPNTQPVPAPCGQLGGLSGTIYAVHPYSGGSDWEPIVNINASGVANLQVIASMIHFTSKDGHARLAYQEALFANGQLRLVE